MVMAIKHSKLSKSLELAGKFGEKKNPFRRGGKISRVI
jgi:hypothetical protein